MDEREAGTPVHLRLMNEYSVDMPLWDDTGHVGDDGLDLSDELRADLAAFAERWEAAVPDEVFDDRWDGVPVMARLVSARYAVRRLLDPAGRRRAVAEDAAMARLGEQLRARLADELGPAYVVTYRR